MKFKSKIKMKEENLEKNLQYILYKISDERKLSRGTKYSYYNSNDGDILDLHFIDENVVYFGAAEDKTLNEFEEKVEIDLDWL